MGNEQSKVLPLIRRDDERSLRKLIAKHGPSILAASYEHKDNDDEWPSFGVSFVLFKIIGSVCVCVCVAILKFISLYQSFAVYLNNIKHVTRQSFKCNSCTGF